MDTEALAALGAAAVQVAEDSLFALAEPCAASHALELVGARPPDEPWIRATVRFHGPFAGAATVTLPHELASELCGAFSGEPGAIDAASVHDFSGELANMTCGLWLTREHGECRFDLEAPHVHEITSALDVTGAASWLLVNDVPVAVTLTPASAGRH